MAPRLVVLIAVDQLRADLLEVYRPAFRGGLRRLLDDGRWFPNARIAHVPSNSMPGHVTLATGMHPRHHGIVDNGFFEFPSDSGAPHYVSAIDDSTERIIGSAGERGVSPRRLEADGIADWILARDSASRVVALSQNQYGSLLHAGRGAARRAVYWYSPGAGRFVTSSYYGSVPAPWVAAANADLARVIPGETLWVSRVPPEARALALPDSAPWENDRKHTTLPHRWPLERIPGWTPTQSEWLYFTPFVDSLAFALAKRAVTTMQLGRGPAVDYLSIAVGSTDAIGHWYGPRSLEQLDNLLRLDRDLGAFLEMLDRTVGRERYVLALGADHGTADVPEAPRAPNAVDFGPVTGGRIADTTIERLFTELAAAAPRRLPPDSARAIAERVLRAQPFVAAVMRRSELAESDSAPADSFVTFYRNGWHPRRVPVGMLSGRAGTLARFGLVARLQPGSVDGDEVPTGHGSPYDYDRRVALVLYGAGVPRGRDERPVLTIDVAPTLAALAGIAPTRATDGRPLLDAPR